MKIAIHHKSGSFSDHWIKYCVDNGINYKLVNCYDSNIIKTLEDCDALMWHHHHMHIKDVLFAKQLLYSLEISGKKVFPNFRTSWHFDDKVGQKYLFEAVNAPLIPSDVFYDKKEAIKWARSITYPKVFKVRRGSSARNVSLIYSPKEAIAKINIAFGKGFKLFNKFQYISDKFKLYKSGKGTFLTVLKSVLRVFLPINVNQHFPREKGYIYFQDFIPNNDYDIRLIVIGDKAYGMKRKVRKNDFRASGSGDFVYDKIDPKVLKVAFETSDKLGFQCMAYDFVFDKDNNPLIVEISYVYGTKGSSKCPGYWDKNLNWHEGKFNPFAWMLEGLIKDIK